MVEYRTRTKRYLELWFDEIEPDGRFDVVVRHRAPQPSPSGENEEFHSLHIDLTREPDDIFKGFARNTRAQIRKCTESDNGLRYEFDRPTPELTTEFEAYYNEFARSKGLAPVPHTRLRAYFESDSVLLARALEGTRTLVWHVNATAQPYVTLMYSASQFRSGDEEFKKLVGRANRRLHWEELLHFKRAGFRTFDFGGWYAGSTDTARLAINRFKEEFGGAKVLEFSSIENRSLLAKTAAAVHRLRAGAARSLR